MGTLALLVAAAALLSVAYAFGFQRLTRELIMTRLELSASSPDGQRVQSLMTPAWIGLMGWIGQLGGLVAVGLLWLSFGWIWAISYAVGAFLTTVVLPYGMLGRHYASIVLRQLTPIFQRAVSNGDTGMQAIVGRLLAGVMSVFQGNGIAGATD